MTEHTPFSVAMECIVDCNGKAIARLENGVTLDHGEFIVRACNSHTDLLEALEAIRTRAYEAKDKGLPIGMSDIFAITNAAISKATQ